MSDHPESASQGDVAATPSHAADAPERRTDSTGGALDRDLRLHELLSCALDVPASERRELLESMEQDAGLIEDVLELLTDEHDTFLATSPAHYLGEHGLVPPLDLPEVPGFDVLSVLGEGGMGRVFLAVQESADRTVALKMIRAAVPGPELLRRFQAERQALSRLNHPAIAQLYGAGTADDGRHFVAMEYVDGLPIHRYCDSHRLDLRQRLELFVEVCRGVEHAHRRQLLHRDLKPSNLLIADEGGRPHAKIIDFGIARALDVADGVTVSDGTDVVGTPAYMSPEAVRPCEGLRDLDTRTDVYSLGVVLYQLLVSVRPYDTGTQTDPLSLMQRIVNDETPRPSRRWQDLAPDHRTEAAKQRRATADDVRRLLCGDLDWIVMQAMAKEREERYGSAAELAADIQRHLGNEPVLAGAPTLRYRLGKLVRRHRLPVATAALALLALVAGVIGTSLGMLQARAAAEQEAQARQEETAARQQAEAVVGFLMQIFQASAVNSQGVRRAPSEVTALDLLDAGKTSIDEELQGQPLQAARFRSALASAYQNLGLYDDAAALLVTSQEQLEVLESSPQGARPLAQIELQLAKIDASLARPEEALEHLTRAETLARKTSRDGEPVHLLPQIRDRESKILRQQARFDDAEAKQREAIALQTAASGEDDDMLVSLIGNLGGLYFEQGRWAEAEVQFKAAHDVSVRVLGIRHARTARLLDNLAAAIASQGRLDEAAPRFAEALDIRRTLLPENHPALAISLNNLGTLALDRDRPGEAEDFHRQALAIRRHVFGDYHPATAWSHDGLAQALADQEQIDAAVQEMGLALDIRRQSLASQHPAIRRSLRLLGHYQRRGGHLEAAAQRFRDALATLPSHRSTPDPTHAEVALDLVEVLLDLERTDEARTALAEAEAFLTSTESGPQPLRPRVETLRARLQRLP